MAPLTRKRPSWRLEKDLLRFLTNIFVRLHTPDEWVWTVCGKHPDVFIPSCSVHPYRLDALEALEHAHKRGIKMIKWLPNSMGIDPLHPKCIPFFEKVKEYGMVILSHAGEEKAVEADLEAQELGNPLRMSRALNLVRTREQNEQIGCFSQCL